MHNFFFKKYCLFVDRNFSINHFGVEKDLSYSYAFLRFIHTLALLWRIKKKKTFSEKKKFCVVLSKGWVTGSVRMCSSSAVNKY